MKTLRFALFLLPFALASMAQAQCFDHERQAQSCMDGTQWDDETGTCVPVISS